MFKLIIPIILIAVAIGGLFLFVNPFYQDISLLNGQVDSYNQALDNSKALENERDKLTAKYNAISPEGLDRLNTFLPNNVDNIRLILEIERVAGPYGMVLRDVKYNTVSENEESVTGNQVAPGGFQPGNAPQFGNPNYGVWDLEFSTQGTYANFVNFVRDLENNLRIVDIASVDFSSNVGGTGSGASSSASSIYRYTFKIKTYWLKN